MFGRLWIVLWASSLGGCLSYNYVSIQGEQYYQFEVDYELKIVAEIVAKQTDCEVSTIEVTPLGNGPFIDKAQAKDCQGKLSYYLRQYDQNWQAGSAEDTAEVRKAQVRRKKSTWVHSAGVGPIPGKTL